MTVPSRFFLILIGCLLGIACQQTPAPAVSPSEQHGLMKVGDTELFVRVKGSGEPLIVLHGGPGMEHGYLYPQMSSLGDSLQVIFFDQRNCGRSPVETDSSRMNMAQFVADISVLADSLGLDKFHLMGHSWGGLLAMWYARSHPERLSSLILVNSLAADTSYIYPSMVRQMERFTDADQLTMERLTRSEAFQNREPQAVEAAFRFSFAASFYERKFLDSLALFIPEDQKARQPQWPYLVPDLTGYDLYEDLAALELPVLILHGQQDATPFEAHEKLASMMPQAELRLIPQAGHFVFIEQEETFEQYIRDFMLRGKLSP
ncbi:MAG: alpha/beta fold hydrolase [Bacteroidota bacterium]